MSVSFKGIREEYVTFQCASDLKAGVPVKLTANGTVGACGANDRLIGVAADVSTDDHALVQTAGYVELAYSGTAPTVGWTKLICTATGVTAESATNGGEYLVIEVDTQNSKVGFML